MRKVSTAAAQRSCNFAKVGALWNQYLSESHTAHFGFWMALDRTARSVMNYSRRNHPVAPPRGGVNCVHDKRYRVQYKLWLVVVAYFCARRLHLRATCALHACARALAKSNPLKKAQIHTQLLTGGVTTAHPALRTTNATVMVPRLRTTVQRLMIHVCVIGSRRYEERSPLHDPTECIANC